ncbi:MAG: M15 family metallopeptidase [Acidimicrobiales bacterium]|nr:M15 family metallopeptidase [Acidimicrobiales bacterium]
MLVGLPTRVVAVAAFVVGANAASDSPGSSGSSARDGRPAGARPAPDATDSVVPDGVVDEADGVVDEAEVAHEADGVVDEADGLISDWVAVSVFDEEMPAVGNLDPGLLDALQRAARAADAEGVGFRVNSGWRSPEYQDRLFLEAILEHGSQEEAARWVATAETSAHVSGDAVDIGPPDAAAWVSTHGAAHGLCPIYRNEPWHVELRPDAVDGGCPPLYADPTDDPRRQ